MAGIQAVTVSHGTASLPSHTHRNVHQLIFVLEGHLRVVIGGTHYRVERPSVILISHLEPHAISVESPTYRRVCIDLVPDAIEREIKSDRLISILSNRPEGFCHVVNIEPLLPRLVPLLMELSDQFNSGEREIADGAAGLFKSLLIMLYRCTPEAFPFENNSVSAIIRSIKQSIESDLTDDRTLEELAEQFHISRYYLAHCYKQTTGYSIKNYRMLCRIAAARELLTSTSLSVSDICERIGFSNMSNFSRYFKKETGLSPLRYRALHKNERNDLS